MVDGLRSRSHAKLDRIVSRRQTLLNALVGSPTASMATCKLWLWLWLWRLLKLRWALAPNYESVSPSQIRKTRVLFHE